MALLNGWSSCGLKCKAWDTNKSLSKYVHVPKKKINTKKYLMLEFRKIRIKKKCAPEGAHHCQVFISMILTDNELQVPKKLSAKKAKGAIFFEIFLILIFNIIYLLAVVV